MSFNTSYLSLILIGLFFYNGAMDLPPLPRSRSFADISQLTEKNKLPLRRSNSESHLLLPEMPEQISVQFQSLGSSKEKSSSTFQQATLSSSSLKSGSYTIDPAVGVGTGAFEAISNTQIKEHIDRDFKQDESEDIQLCFDTQVQKRVDQWISELKNPQRDTPHGLLLYGPSGVGKTSLVKFLAKKTGYELLIINAPECITPYQGSGVETIQRNFRKAVELKRPVIILIEEIDCFASTDIKRDNSTSHNTATQVHLLLDRVQADYPNIFIFVTTNYYQYCEQFLKF